MNYLFNLQPSDVNNVYVGLQGCACGCRGTYYENDERAARRTLNKLTKLQQSDTPLLVMEGFSEWIVCYETEQRATRLYVSKDLTEYVNEDEETT